MSQKIIIDTDPGIDDALAILFAFAHPGLDVVGLTTVFGNVPVSLATENALRLVELAGVDVPVAPGAAKPLLISPRGHADFVHGEDGFGNTHTPHSSREARKQGAAEFIVEQVRSAPDAVTLVPVGPLTNIALALKLAPDICEKTRVVLMGGAVNEPGNCSPVAEANIWQDPHAAEIVFAAKWHVTLRPAGKVRRPTRLGRSPDPRCGPRRRQRGRACIVVGVARPPRLSAHAEYAAVRRLSFCRPLSSSACGSTRPTRRPYRPRPGSGS